ncbi:hypothetical protein HZU73_07261 [Apis mellifera caucasica]|nr:hypothetical protein HZU73_07261 [Apis mellifera caucasica]KAG9430116.1 hypothetical protein HZU67_08397 [Apis mellifera carnica]
MPVCINLRIKFQSGGSDSEMTIVKKLYFGASSVRGPDSPLSSDLALDKPRPIPSPRQIHPLYGEKAGLLGYCDPLGNAENFPPAPNIVVEGGRIEFVRPSQDGTTTPRRNTMSRGSQTFNDEPEKSDPAKQL